jgi:farnesyl diphosphate synthase
MIADRLLARRELVEAALDRALPPAAEWPATVHAAMRHSLLGGGKRLRPLLVLEAGSAVRGDEDELLRFACAVEMIHTYSLVHDDLPAMDDDDLRRGRPTCHKAFGEAAAILAGDALLTRAFEILAEVGADEPEPVLRRRIEATSLLARAAGTGGLIGGQMADLEAEGRDLPASDVERIHRAKTAALLSACVEGAAALAGALPAERAALVRYGRALGLAFQIVDDVLDATGDAAELGKTAGKDAQARKATYVRAHGLERARQMADGLGREAREALAPLGERAEGLLHLAHLVVERRA